MSNHKVLWTGGWDSTFRILDLILNKKVSVQPYYILDEDRKSTRMELHTMDNIRTMIYQMNDKLANNLATLKIIKINNIPKNEGITQSYKVLSSQSHLGSQYDWLARYCEYNNISALELCIHNDDTVEGFIKNDVTLVDENIDKYYILNNETTQPELSIFSYYHYPLFDMTKLDMERCAQKSGFGHIMEETWFCHSPIGNKPCGMCNPCKYTKEEGLGRRVPNPTVFMKVRRKLGSKWKGLKRKLRH